MDKTRIRTLLKRALLTTALPALVVISDAQAAVTYSFRLESATYGGSSLPIADSDFLYTRGKIATLQATLTDPGAGGTLAFSYASGGSPYGSADPECAIYCIVNYSVSGMSIDSTAAWFGFSSFAPPVCNYLFCRLDAALKRESSGLDGWFELWSTNDTLRLSGTGNDWIGTWSSDGPGYYGGPIVLAGRWLEIPLPGTLLLLSFGLAASGMVHRRRLAPPRGAKRPSSAGCATG